jgi:hypothetical protein
MSQGIASTIETATILSGASLSNEVHLKSMRPFAIEMPTTWTAANLTFQVTTDGTTYRNLYDDTGAEVTVTASGDRYIALVSPAQWIGVQRFKIRSGTSGVPVNQGADRALHVVGES